MRERLQKVMAQAGLGSRRFCEEIIKEGRVKVNGKVAVLGMKAKPGKDLITVDGKPLGPKEQKRYIMLYKPGGYITTVQDQFGRPSILDLLANLRERVYPVGRLDYDSEGLVLLTNDGALAYRVMHPKFELAKTYLVQVTGKITKDAVRHLRQGVALEEGLTAPAQVKILKSSGKGSLLHITLREGRNRQIRRMGAKVGFPVQSLLRIAVGPLQLGNLPQGEFRELTPQEIMELKKAVGLP
ncbi:MAG: rRNA pseudouridine synthase [Firmicutes bacterium]|nr:rRNA pseudouridine synthase [Bacillota bacterium]